jgi:hypothetical protein
MTGCRDRTRGRDALLWAVGWLCAGQLLLTVLMDCGRPDLRDPEYTIRLARLRARLADNPGRSLVLMLGSSRVRGGFQPECLNRLAEAAGEPVVAFNFGLLCAGPLREHCCLRHLLADHVRPDLLLVEIMPELFNEPGKGRFCEENWLYIPPLTLADLVELWPYFARPHRLYLPWLRSRLEPWNEHRLRALAQLAVDGRPPPTYVRLQEDVGPWGWAPPPTLTVTEDEQRHHITAALKQYGPAFQDFRLGREPCHITRDLLETCRREGIPTLLVRMPQATVFRTCYPPEMEAAVGRLGRALGECYGAEFIDAQRWIPDAEFWDGHHLLPAGAARFTERLGQDVILPRLQRRLAKPPL